MSKINFFIGPMTKNVVDSVVEFNSFKGGNVAFIPSRRQVSLDGGYVNDWTTESFRQYVPQSFICRDHAGPGQGIVDDNGYESLKNDCKLLDMIHIDPWKKYSDFDIGVEWTVDMINFCCNEDENVTFEVGTEQAIRYFTVREVETLLKKLKTKLSSENFNRIKYCVIQSGTSLRENENTGAYSQERLVSMVSAVKEYGLMTKEHNGDYLPDNLIKEKFKLGLDSINIAPEFGQIETQTYLKIIKEHNHKLLDKYWEICYNSMRWKKWVDNTFDPMSNKEQLINICGHYVLSSKEFNNKIRTELPSVDGIVKANVISKLEKLHER